MPENLSVSLFVYPLPPELIAQKPIEPRDQSRLLVCQGQGRLGEWTTSPLLLNPKKENHFSDIQEMLGAGDLLIMNDAKVLPVRLLGHRELETGEVGGSVEALLLRPEPLSNPLNEATSDGRPIWTALMHMSAKAKPGLRFIFRPGLVAECLTTTEERLARDGEVRLAFSGLALDRMNLETWLVRHGNIPLPPYIDRNSVAEDVKQYQTVYASKIGSAAAPTAGFHFTDDLLQNLRGKGVEFATLTLHIGIGTFRPMSAATIEEHKMHTENFEVTQELADTMRRVKAKGGRIVAVGTTVVRSLESWWHLTEGRLEPGVFKTNLFITPGFQFQMVDDMITNFHLPKSTLLVLVAAACCQKGAPSDSGVQQMRRIYEYALEKKYRFFSYGDAMFLRGQS